VERKIVERTKREEELAKIEEERQSKVEEFDCKRRDLVLSLFEKKIPNIARNLHYWQQQYLNNSNDLYQMHHSNQQRHSNRNSNHLHWIIGNTHTPKVTARKRPFNNITNTIFLVYKLGWPYTLRPMYPAARDHWYLTMAKQSTLPWVSTRDLVDECPKFGPSSKFTTCLLPVPC